ncbi:kinesin-like protein KIF6 isoform X4 [Corythoichthys intestinalis]|uniref:kinesin-like protein KIF6 isoform X4 n=1 Tax=Corythoichthys intestinalis TaxID=161448 RepID=UPI0025A5AEE1|nr:kinesin-like protein KIF6 isoform X4 [Corythoichthys intestinalis]
MVKQTIQIYARVKPNKKNTAVYSVNNEDPASSSLEFVVPKEVADGFVNNKRECFNFRFQKVFDQATKQDEIFEHIAKPVAESVLAGYNGTIFAYGQTGSGKTFTITGGAERYNDRGIIPRTLSYLYERFGQDSSTVYSTHISYLEIYNEMGYDLLESRNEASQLEDLPKVIIMEDSDQNIHLRNLSLQQSANEEEALNLLFLGDTNRMIAEVIIALSERNRCHIPYRNSVLTSVLRDSLGGNCKTTMIATLAVDKRNLDESISTCRFAQRVAIIKNEAILNEELDPTLLITRLRQEVQSLKEELTMLTGEQRDDQLTVEEKQMLGESVKTFLDDPDPDVTLTLGPDMRKIQHCFYLLKMMILGNRSGNCSNRDIQESPTALLEEKDIQEPHCAEEVNKLKELLVQRDNEIRILVKILKREGKIANESSIQLASISNGHRHTSKSDASLAAMLLQTAGNNKPNSTGTIGQAVQCMQRGPQFSMGKQEAFETFLAEHDDHHIIEDNKSLLKQRSAEARKLGEQLHDVREKINEYKKQLELRRRQQAAYGVTENHKDVGEEVDPVEENLRVHIEQEKKIYKSTAGRLKALRTEIEHLQLLLERAKVKLQRDFQKWWNEEASIVQESKEKASHWTKSLCGTLPPSSHCTPGFEYMSSTVRPHSARGDRSSSSGQDLRTLIPKTARSNTVREEQEAGFTSSEWRVLSKSSLPPSSIPLTGDQQADADILAFIRARQNLLNRAGNTQTHFYNTVGGMTSTQCTAAH